MMVWLVYWRFSFREGFPNVDDFGEGEWVFVEGEASNYGLYEKVVWVVMLGGWYRSKY